jgi:hypothetical protein
VATLDHRGIISFIAEHETAGWVKDGWGWDAEQSLAYGCVGRLCGLACQTRECDTRQETTSKTMSSLGTVTEGWPQQRIDTNTDE